MPVVKVPRELWISGSAYQVRLQRGLLANSDNQGQSCGNASLIEVDPELNTSKRTEVFLHECVHQIGNALGWTRKAPLAEADVIALGHGLAGLCRELGIELDFSELAEREV